MKRVELYWIQVFAACAVSLSVGLSVGMLMERNREPVSHVPKGVFSPLVMLEDHSLQISYGDLTETSLTAWVREDRRSWFISESTLPAQTTITKLSVNCNKLSVVIDEQRVFGFAMQYIATIKGREYFEGKTPLIAKHLLETTCHISAPEPPAVEEETGLTA